MGTNEPVDNLVRDHPVLLLLLLLGVNSQINPSCVNICRPSSSRLQQSVTPSISPSRWGAAAGFKSPCRVPLPSSPSFSLRRTSTPTWAPQLCSANRLRSGRLGGPVRWVWAAAPTQTAGTCNRPEDAVVAKASEYWSCWKHVGIGGVDWRSPWNVKTPRERR